MTEPAHVSKSALLWAAITTILLVAFLAAPLFLDLEFARTYLIGPRGVFSVFWMILIAGGVAVAARTLERKK